MEINRTNYEAYFIDYLEGNLDEGLVDSFIEFLKLNPDLKEELEMYEPVSVIPSPVAFGNKIDLYKEKYDSEEEFNQAAIASLEGNLSEETEQEFKRYVSSHSEKQKELTLFSKTILKADESVVFSKKSNLYKKSLGKTILLWTSRVAAVLVLAIAVFSLLKKEPAIVNQENQLAKTEQNIEKQEITPANKTEIAETIQTESPVQKGEHKSEPNAPATKNEIKSVAPVVTPPTKKEDALLKRIPINLPEKMNTLTASIDVQNPRTSLATMYISYPEDSYEEEFLADRVKEKINVNRITKAGLNLFTSISNERFTYETDKDGKVTEYSYDSRLLAFSIPGRRSSPE